MTHLVSKVQVGSLTVAKSYNTQDDIYLYEIMLEDGTSMTINCIEYFNLATCMKALDVIGE